MPKENPLIIEKNDTEDESLALILQRAGYSVTRVSSFPEAEAELAKQKRDFFNIFIIVRPEVLTEHAPFVMDFIGRVKEQYEWNAPVILFSESPQNYPMPINILARGPIEFFLPDKEEEEMLDLIEKFFVPPEGLDKFKSIILETKKSLEENASKEEIEFLLRELKIALTKQWQQDYEHPHSQYQQGLVVFDIAVRRLSKDTPIEELTTKQLDALLEAFELLKVRPLTHAELNLADRLLEKADIDTRVIRFNTAEDLKQYLKSIF